jgi:hypothetical protein
MRESLLVPKHVPRQSFSWWCKDFRLLTLHGSISSLLRVVLPPPIYTNRNAVERCVITHTAMVQDCGRAEPKAVAAYFPVFVCVFFLFAY